MDVVLIIVKVFLRASGIVTGSQDKGFSKQFVHKKITSAAVNRLTQTSRISL